MYPYFEDFPPIFENCEVGRDDIGEHMKELAERNQLLPRPRKMLISSFKLERGPVITPLLLFYLEKGVILKDVYWFLQYTPRRSFETFVQNVFDARRDGDQNKESTVVAETMKLIGNSSYGYQIMDRSRHTNTKYVKGSQVNKFINNRFFKTMNELPEQIYEVEMSKSRIDHKEPIIVGFFILQYAKLTMLQLKYNFFSPFCDKNKYEVKTSKLKWIPTVSTWPLMRKKLMKSFNQKCDQCGTGCDGATAMITSQQTPAAISHENVAETMLPLTRELLDSLRMNLGAMK